MILDQYLGGEKMCNSCCKLFELLLDLQLVKNMYCLQRNILNVNGYFKPDQTFKIKSLELLHCSHKLHTHKHTHTHTSFQIAMDNKDNVFRKNRT